MSRRTSELHNHRRCLAQILARFALLFAGLLLLGAADPASPPPDPLVQRALESKQYLFVEFFSRTCPACDEMRPVVESALADYANVGHQSVDADREVELSKRYDVKCVPVYVVIDPLGKVRFNDVGLRTKQELQTILDTAGARRR